MFLQKNPELKITSELTEIGIVLLLLIVFCALRILPHFINIISFMKAKFFVSIGLLFFIYRGMFLFIPASSELGPMLINIIAIVSVIFERKIIIVKCCCLVVLFYPYQSVSHFIDHVCSRYFKIKMNSCVSAFHMWSLILNHMSLYVYVCFEISMLLMIIYMSCPLQPYLECVIDNS